MSASGAFSSGACGWSLIGKGSHSRRSSVGYETLYPLSSLMEMCPLEAGGRTNPVCSAVSLWVETVALMRTPGSGNATMKPNRRTRSMNESLVKKGP